MALKEYCGGREAVVPEASQPEMELGHINNIQAPQPDDIAAALEAFLEYDYPVDEILARGYRTKCSICIIDYIHGEHVLALPYKHVFHPACVDDLLRYQQDECPYW